MSYLGMAIGSLAGLFVVYFYSDSLSESMAQKHGVKSPEVVLYEAHLITVSTYFVLLVTVSPTNWTFDVWLVC
jgi:hypothetical protein